MPNYKLNILFNSKDVATVFDAGQNVVLLKKTSTGNSVAWVTFQPFESNYVSWNDNYAIYASNSELKSGATIDKLSEVSAVSKQLYTFNKGTFDPPESNSDIQEGQYAIEHKMAGYDTLIFGLTQEAKCNGVLVSGSPINASIVPLNQSAKFTPYEIVTVYLEADITNGTVVTNVISNSLDVTFGGDTTEATIQYDSSIGGFKQIK
ncbi:hypothetical protein [Clostridium coskatii]|uniref:Uncharacterized protein n=1 Tax=Clostridium coskatii TaxID=1705578 RepID=A0A166UK45_9CLOT|nr:hypothetical protein [Clostridium coskatii]OAA94994.1 hypothetical protein WX73_01403 [Clostridium coskatii]OBR94299.1 hypothetical protein CLCOS_20210 [Clostridium coskatii]